MSNLYRQFHAARKRDELAAALERAKERSHRLPDGRYVLDVMWWPGMKIETPKIWDYKERKEAVEGASVEELCRGLEVVGV